MTSSLEELLYFFLNLMLQLLAIIKPLDDTEKSGKILVFVAHIWIYLLKLVDHVHKIVHGIGKDSGTQEEE